jgi:bisphosphoglycerate-independent phosphoglycerate mutase (AlkP superfamily)
MLANKTLAEEVLKEAFHLQKITKKSIFRLVSDGGVHSHTSLIYED